VTAFATDSRLPAAIRSVMFSFFAHATNATGIEIVGGKDCNTIDREGLARFIKLAHKLGYDEGGLYENKGIGEGDYLIKREVEEAQPNSNEALALHLSEAIRIVRDRDDLPGTLVEDLHDAVVNFNNDLPSLAAKDNSERGILLTLDFYVEQMRERKGGAKQ
jgi:hypothetical protein